MSERKTDRAEGPVPAQKYVAVVGIQWTDAQTGKEHRAEPGTAVPAEVVGRARWLLEQGQVREA